MRFGRAFSCLLVAVLAAPAPARAQGWVVAVGGGAESDDAGSWSETPYRVLATAAGAREAVVLSVRDETRWIPDYLEALGAASASNLRVASREQADDPAVADRVAAAGAVFVKGGDQWEYVRLWRDTRLAAAIRSVWASGGAVGGTSAGAHVLGEVVFDARSGTLLPEEVLRDGLHPRLTLTTGFLDLLPGVLVDSHFTRRGRLLRLIPMCAATDREITGAPVLGVGVDERTALVVAPDLVGEVVGEGSVSFVRLTRHSVVRLASGRPPVVTEVAVDRLTEGFAFDLAARRVVRLPAAATRVTGFSPDPSPGWPRLVLDGGDAAVAELGEVRLGPAADTDPDALWLGRLEEVPGRGELARAVVVPRVLASADLVENRVGGLHWMLASHPGWCGVLLDSGSRVAADPPGRLRPLPGREEASVLLVDSRGVWVTGLSPRWARDDADGPRQSAALAGLRMHLLASGWSWRCSGGGLGRVPPAGVVRRAGAGR